MILALHWYTAILGSLGIIGLLAFGLWRNYTPFQHDDKVGRKRRENARDWFVEDSLRRKVIKNVENKTG